MPQAERLRHQVFRGRRPPIFIVEGDERFPAGKGSLLTGRAASRDEEPPNLPVAFVPHRRTCFNAAGFRRETDKLPRFELFHNQNAPSFQF